jgi:hypothetical protein
MSHLRNDITRRTNTTYTVLQARQVSVLSRYLTLLHRNRHQVLTTELKLRHSRHRSCYPARSLWLISTAPCSCNFNNQVIQLVFRWTTTCVLPYAYKLSVFSFFVSAYVIRQDTRRGIADGRISVLQNLWQKLNQIKLSTYRDKLPAHFWHLNSFSFSDCTPKCSSLHSSAVSLTRGITPEVSTRHSIQWKPILKL